MSGDATLDGVWAGFVTLLGAAVIFEVAVSWAVGALLSGRGRGLVDDDL